jgi:hypothetical protein
VPSDPAPPLCRRSTRRVECYEQLRDPDRLTVERYGARARFTLAPTDGFGPIDENRQVSNIAGSYVHPRAGMGGWHTRIPYAPACARGRWFKFGILHRVAR